MKIAPPDSVRCQKTVYQNRGLTSHRCWFRSVRDGFCRRHHPDAARARDLKIEKRRDQQDALVRSFIVDEFLKNQVETNHLLVSSLKHAPPKLKRRIERHLKGEE